MKQTKTRYKFLNVMNLTPKEEYECRAHLADLFCRMFSLDPKEIVTDYVRDVRVSRRDYVLSLDADSFRRWFFLQRDGDIPLAPEVALKIAAIERLR